MIDDLIGAWMTLSEIVRLVLVRGAIWVLRNTRRALRTVNRGSRR